MPTLQSLTCHVHSTATHSPLPEYGVQYFDGRVECWLPVPLAPIGKDEKNGFYITLASRGYIAPGLALFVYIDGVYQCNRNRRGIPMPFAAGGNVAGDVRFVVRQKEVLQRDGTMWGMPWRWGKVVRGGEGDIAAAVSAEGPPPFGGEYIGTIEVVVLRCGPVDRAPESVSVFRGPPPSRVDGGRASLGLGLYDPWIGPPMGGFDGADDGGDVGPLWMPGSFPESPGERAPIAAGESTDAFFAQTSTDPKVIVSDPVPDLFSTPANDGEWSNAAATAEPVAEPFTPADFFANTADFVAPEIEQQPSTETKNESNTSQDATPISTENQTAPDGVWGGGGDWDTTANAPADEIQPDVAFDWNADFPAALAETAAQDDAGTWDTGGEVVAAQAAPENAEQIENNFAWAAAEDAPATESQPTQTTEAATPLFSTIPKAPTTSPYWSTWTNACISSEIIPRVPSLASKAKAPPIVPAETADKYHISHQLCTDSPRPYLHRLSRPEYLDTHEKPFAVFCFRYRDTATVEKLLGVKVAEQELELQKRKEEVEKKLKEKMEEDEKKRLGALSKEQLVEEIFQVRRASVAAVTARAGSPTKVAAQQPSLTTCHIHKGIEPESSTISPVQVPAGHGSKSEAKSSVAATTPWPKWSNDTASASKVPIIQAKEKSKGGISPGQSADQEKHAASGESAKAKGNSKVAATAKEAGATQEPTVQNDNTGWSFDNIFASSGSSKDTAEETGGWFKAEEGADATTAPSQSGLTPDAPEATAGNSNDDSKTQEDNMWGAVENPGTEKQSMWGATEDPTSGPPAAADAEVKW